MQDLVDQIAQQHLQRVRVKEDFVASACPFHKGGQESHASFWINRKTGYWGCFTCQEGGGGLKALLKKLGVKASAIDGKIEAAEQEAKKYVAVNRARERIRSRKEFKGESILPDALLGVFDWLPLDLVNAGFTKELLREHDIGFDRRLRRITFPVRDLYGNLIGISGRSTQQNDHPKYLFYNGRRTVAGKEYSGELGEWYPAYTNETVRDHLWRMEKCYERVNRDNEGQLIIVEGFKAALSLVQRGWLNTVALMGARISPAQERIVRSLGCTVFVLLDNNYAGKIGAKRVCQRLAVSTFPVYRCTYPAYCDEDVQPDDLDDQELESVLSNAKRVGGVKNVRPKFRSRMGRQHYIRPGIKSPEFLR